MAEGGTKVMEVAFRSILAGNPAVTAIVGDRLFFVQRPQDERRPCVILTRVSTLFGRNFRATAGWARGRMQFDCLAPSYPTVKELAAAVRDAIEDYTGTIDNTLIDQVTVDEERDTPVAPLEGRASPTYGVQLDAAVLYQEPTT
jgi:hypothetical protein